MRRLLVTLGIFLVNILLAEVPVNCLIMLEVVVLGVVPVLAAEDDLANTIDDILVKKVYADGLM